MSWDRFEAMVEKATQMAHGKVRAIRPDVAVQLLRREHAAIVRAVTRLRDNPRFTYDQALDDVLALLAKRKGRKG